MENKLLEKLDDLNIKETNYLLEKNIDLSLDHLAIKRIEKSVKKKTGYYNSNYIFNQKISDILGGFTMKRKIALALATIVVSSLGGGVYAHAKTTPVAYVSVDINPSVELGVNAFDEVVSAEAYNEDGEKVLEGTNLVNSDVEDAVKTIITNAASNGYIKEDDTITNDVGNAATTTSAAVEITVATDKDNVADKLEDSLKETADKTLEDNDVEAEVETANVALARRDEARQLGITPGKLNLIQKLQALDPNIKVEDYKTSSVKDIQKKAKELRKMNKSEDAITDNNASTDVNSDTNTSTNAISEQSTNASIKENGNSQKEEKHNNGKKDYDSSTEKSVVNKSEKQKNNGNSNSQNNGNKGNGKNN